jgi:hypothetical protein
MGKNVSLILKFRILFSIQIPPIAHQIFKNKKIPIQLIYNQNFISLKHMIIKFVFLVVVGSTFILISLQIFHKIN